MATAVVTFLIYVCVLVLLFYLVLWVVRDVLGVPIPAKVIQILWVIIALIVILWLLQMVPGLGLPHFGR